MNRVSTGHVETVTSIISCFYYFQCTDSIVYQSGHWEPFLTPNFMFPMSEVHY